MSAEKKPSSGSVDEAKRLLGVVRTAKAVYPVALVLIAVVLTAGGWMTNQAIGGVKAKQGELETRIGKVEANEARWLEAMQDVRERLARIEGKLDQQRNKP